MNDIRRTMLTKASLRTLLIMALTFVFASQAIVWYQEKSSSGNSLPRHSPLPANMAEKNAWPPLMGGSVQGGALKLEGTVSVFSGSGVAGALDDTGVASSFSGILDIVKVGNDLYAIDSTMIRKIDLVTGIVSTMKLNGRGAGIHMPNIGFMATVDSDLYVSLISDLGTVLKIGIDSGQRTQLTEPVPDGDNFSFVTGLTAHGKNLYMLSKGRIVKYSIDARTITELVGSDVFSRPTGITSDGTNLYVADSGNHLIRKVDIASGKVTTLAGGAHRNQTTEPVDGTGESAVFYYPSNITVEGDSLYVSDASQRADGLHAIRKISISSGLVTTLTENINSAGGPGKPIKFKSPRGLLVSDGNLYVAEANKIFKYEISSRKLTVVAGSGAWDRQDGNGVDSTPLFMGPVGITVQGNNIYETEYSDRTLQNANIRKIDLLEGRVTTLNLQKPSGGLAGRWSAARLRTPGDIVSDGNNLYVADPGSFQINKIEISSGKVTTFVDTGSYSPPDETIKLKLGSLFAMTLDGDNLYVVGENSVSQISIGTGILTNLPLNEKGHSNGSTFFKNPRGITTVGSNLYITDTGNHRIRKVDLSSGELTTLAGSGAHGKNDGIGSSASFGAPWGIATDSNNLYVTDKDSCNIRMIGIATGQVSTLVGSCKSHASYAIPRNQIDGIGKMAFFEQPQGIAYYKGKLYVSDSHQYRIREVVIATGQVTTLAGSFEGSMDGSIVAGPGAAFNEAFGIASDGKNLYVSDTINHKIRKIRISDGVVETLAGTGSDGFTDGKGVEAQLNGPFGITTDGKRLFVADTINNVIREINLSTGYVTTLAGSGVPGERDGTGKSASFNHPAALTTNGSHLYVTDTYNHKIRMIDIQTGDVSTLAGSGNRGSNDGIREASSFNFPFGITTDGHNLFVADTYNHKIRKIAINTGTVTTLAGSGVKGVNDGPRSIATFNYPNGLTLDSENLYVADTSNHAIRKIILSTGEVTTLAGSGLIGKGATGIASSFNYPRGITTDGRHLFVADTDNHVVRKIR